MLQGPRRRRRPAEAPVLLPDLSTEGCGAVLHTRTVAMAHLKAAHTERVVSVSALVSPAGPYHGVPCGGSLDALVACDMPV